MTDSVAGEATEQARVRFPWYWIPIGYLGSVVVMVAFAYLWVFLYSVFVHPGEGQEFYEARW